jgi:predicted dehydrogenase
MLILIYLTNKIKVTIIYEMNINTGQIGGGYWGKNLIRNLAQLDTLAAICDSDKKLLKKYSKNYPTVDTTTNYKELLNNPDINAIVIATPASTHYDIVKAALLAGKDVLVEKPFTTTLKEARDLVKIAEEKELILMVGMVFLYNAAVRKVKELIDSGELGNIHYMFFQRRNLGKVRQDVNSWWNLAPHDISILSYWIKQKPINLTVRGFDFIQPGIEDVVMATIEYAQNASAFIHTSWLDPAKVRRAIVVGSKKMVIYDDMSQDMKVQVYDKGIDKNKPNIKPENFYSFGEFQLKQRAGDIHVPKIDFTEPLKEECGHFLNCVDSRREPISSGRKNLDMVHILEAGQESMKNRGKNIEL